MVIGIDIDDTIVDTEKVLLKYANKFNRCVLKKDVKDILMEDINQSYYLETMFGWNKEEMQAFFDTYYINVLKEVKIKENVSNVISSLKSMGHDIVIITARSSNVKDCNTTLETLNYLHEYNIDFDKLILDCSDKVKVAKEEKVDIMIDDNFEICKKMKCNNIACLMFENDVNKKFKDDMIKRVSNWEEVYDIITGLD